MLRFVLVVDSIDIANCKTKYMSYKYQQMDEAYKHCRFFTVPMIIQQVVYDVAREQSPWKVYTKKPGMHPCI